MLSVVVHDFGELAIVRCPGRIVRGEGTNTLGNAVMGLQSKRVIVLDLAEVVSLDGSGVGLLVSLHRWARNNGIRLKLTNPLKLVREVLELTKLDSELDVCTCEEMAALLGFGSATGSANLGEEYAAA